MPSSPATRVLLMLLVLTTAILIAFGPVLRNDFVNFDDQKEIIENPDLNPVTVKGLVWNWSHTRLSLYMPITYMAWAGIASFAARDHSGLLNPVAFHALSLLLHIVCSMLVLFLLLQLFGKRWPALLGGLLFALHPIQTEAVAWASGMYTLLSTVFSLIALMAYVAYATKTQNRPMLFFLLGTLCYALALLTKAASVSVPVAAAVIDYFLLRRPVRQIARSLTVWILMGAVIVVVAKSFQDVSMLGSPSVWARPIIALDAIGFYLHQIVVPIGLIPDYGRNPTWVMHHFSQAAICVAAGCFLLLIALLARRKASGMAAGIGVFIAGVCPYLGLTTFDFQYVSTVADRYAYFGMVGLAILIATMIDRSRGIGTTLLVLLPAWMVLTHRQAQRWHDTQTLFSYTLELNPQSLISHNVFGYLAARDHRPIEAEAHYLAALKVWPQDATIHFNLGNLYLKDQPERAAEHYALATSYEPNFPLYHNNFGVALAKLNQAERAYNQWQQAIAEDRGYVDPRNNLADLLVNLGRKDEARAEYHAVLQMDPNNVHAKTELQNLNTR